MNTYNKASSHSSRPTLIHLKRIQEGPKDFSVFNYAYENQNIRDLFIIQRCAGGRREGLLVDRWDDTELLRSLVLRLLSDEGLRGEKHTARPAPPKACSFITCEKNLQSNKYPMQEDFGL